MARHSIAGTGRRHEPRARTRPRNACMRNEAYCEYKLYTVKSAAGPQNVSRDLPQSHQRYAASSDSLPATNSSS